MQLSIENDTKVQDIQKLFTTYYPFLKIEFYKYSIYNPNKKDTIPITMPLSQVLNKNLTAIINIKKNITVAQVEDDFLQLGIQAEIFRRSGNVWVETFLTSNWTLDQQNLEGEEITRHYIAG